MVEIPKQQHQEEIEVVIPNINNQPVANKKTSSHGAISALVMMIMSIFWCLFVIDLLYTITVNTIHPFFTDPNLMKFIRAFYIIAIIITSICLCIICIKREIEAKYICGMLAILFFILFVTAIIVDVIYEASKNSNKESFGKVFGGIILFSISGPIYCCTHICSCKCCHCNQDWECHCGECKCDNCDCNCDNCDCNCDNCNCQCDNCC